MYAKNIAYTVCGVLSPVVLAILEGGYLFRIVTSFPSIDATTDASASGAFSCSSTSLISVTATRFVRHDKPRFVMVYSISNSSSIIKNNIYEGLEE